MILEALSTKQKFYTQAKKAHGNNPNKRVDLVKFYETCDQFKVVPLPIFTKIQSGQLSIASQYINDGMASALAALLSIGRDKSDIRLTEITLDDNGIKDDSFAEILDAVAHQPDMQIISYSNNSIGPKSVAKLKHIIPKLKELRLCNIKATRQTI